MPELVFAPSAPFPILGASAEWCAMLGAKEEDCKGCGFKAFDSDLFPLTQVYGRRGEGGSGVEDTVRLL